MTSAGQVASKLCELCKKNPADHTIKCVSAQPIQTTYMPVCKQCDPVGWRRANGISEPIR
jgi:hypothetical protein